MTEMIEKYSGDYNIKKCIKCGRMLGVTLTYNKPTDRLIVKCKECGYEYNMRPKDWKENK